MIRTVRTVGVAFVVAVAACAQTPQAANSRQSANAAQAAKNPANGSQQQSAGTIRNDRLATMPRVGVSATFNPNQNEMVGCVVGSGNNLYLEQPEIRRAYQLRGNAGQLQNNVGQMVQVTGRLRMGTPPAFEVQQVQVVQAKCNYAQSGYVLPVTGGTGTQGEAFNVSTTASLGEPTPGVETEAGAKRNPSMDEGVREFGAYPVARPMYSAAVGAPPDPRVEDPAEAERIANSATRSELNSQRQLGVNAEPNYSAESSPQQTQQFTAGEAQQQRGQSSGSTQVLRGGAAGNASGASEPQGSGTTPVFTGCIQQRNGQVVLIETATHATYHLDEQGRNVSSFVNQQVRIAGNITGTYGPAVGTAGNNAIVHVDSIAQLGACTAR